MPDISVGGNTITEISVGGNTITEGWVGGNQVYGTSDASDSVTLTLTQSGLTNASATLGTTTLGEGLTTTLTASPDTNYKFTAASNVTFSETDADITITNKSYSSETGNITATVTAAADVASGATATITVTGSATADNSGMNFTCTTWTNGGGGVSISSNGTVTPKLGNASAVALNASSPTCPDRSSECSSGTCSPIINVTIPSGYANSGTIHCTLSSQTVPSGNPQLDTDAEWTGDVSISAGGTVTITSNGNLDGTVSASPTSFTSNSNGCASIPRSITISGTVNDSDYCNNDSTTSFNVSRTQPAGGSNLNPTPTVTVATNGTVNITDADGLTNTSTNPTSFSSNQNGCATVPRQVTVNGTIPDGYCDAGSYSQSFTVNQDFGNTNFPFNTWDGSISVSTNGAVSISYGSNISVNNVTGVSPCTGNQNDGTLTCPSNATGCDSIARMFTVNYDVDEDSTYCNAGETVSSTYGVSQAAGKTDDTISCSGIGVNANGNITGCPSGATCSPGTPTWTEGTTVKTATTRNVVATKTAGSSFCNSGDTLTCNTNVTQVASAANSLSCDEENLTFDGTGGAITDDNFDVTVTPASSFTVSDNQNWITTSTSGNTVTVTVGDNQGQSNRTGTVTVTHTLDSSLTCEVGITQTGNI